MIIDKFSPSNSSFSSDQLSEKPIRSIIKSLSWRILGTIDTIIISWLITGTLRTAFSIGLIEVGTKMVLYFFHERMWNKITWGTTLK